MCETKQTDRYHYSLVERQTVSSFARRFREEADLAEADSAVAGLTKWSQAKATMENAEANSKLSTPSALPPGPASQWELRPSEGTE